MQAIDFDYPSVEEEARIIDHESKVDDAIALDLALLGQKVRYLRHHGFDEGVSTRLLVYAGQLIARGISPRRACDMAVCSGVSDDTDVHQAISELVSTVFAD